ncbi:MAG: hypothetical protein ACI81P_003294 [Neolewinella sp.]|jgi:hypothetical protein
MRGLESYPYFSDNIGQRLDNLIFPIEVLIPDFHVPELRLKETLPIRVTFFVVLPLMITNPFFTKQTLYYEILHSQLFLRNH